MPARTIIIQWYSASALRCVGMKTIKMHWETAYFWGKSWSIDILFYSEK